MSLDIGVYDPVEVSFRDQSKEIGTFRAYGLELTEATFDAMQAIAEDFVEAMNGITLGTLAKWTYGQERINDNTTLPGNSSAQRENKLRIYYHDITTQKKLTASVPTIFLPSLVFLSEAKDYVNMTTPAQIVAFKTAWEDFVVNPASGNLTVIDAMEFVGTNT